MAVIGSSNGNFFGVSDDGRIEYHTANQSTWAVKIDGLWSDRKRIYDADRKVVDRVSDEDAATALQLCKAVDAALRAWLDELVRAAEARLDARDDALDGIEQVRGGAYDRNTW